MFSTIISFSMLLASFCEDVSGDDVSRFSVTEGKAAALKTVTGKSDVIIVPVKSPVLSALQK